MDVEWKMLALTVFVNYCSQPLGMGERGKPEEFYEVVSASSLELSKKRQNPQGYRSEAMWRMRVGSIALNGRLAWPSKTV